MEKGREMQTLCVSLGGGYMFRNLEAEQHRRNLTNAEVAQILNVSRSTYESKKRNGKFTRPEIVTLLKLFNCKFEYLFNTESA